MRGISFASTHVFVRTKIGWLWLGALLHGGVALASPGPAGLTLDELRRVGESIGEQVRRAVAAGEPVRVERRPGQMPELLLPSRRIRVRPGDPAGVLEVWTEGRWQPLATGVVGFDVWIGDGRVQGRLLVRDRNARGLSWLNATIARAPGASSRP